jgi:hypothetical protein
LTCRLLELLAYGVDGFEGIVLEDFLADFIPDIFIRVEFRQRRPSCRPWAALGSKPSSGYGWLAVEAGGASSREAERFPRSADWQYLYYLY